MYSILTVAPFGIKEIYKFKISEQVEESMSYEYSLVLGIIHKFKYILVFCFHLEMFSLNKVVKASIDSVLLFPKQFFLIPFFVKHTQSDSMS